MSRRRRQQQNQNNSDEDDDFLLETAGALWFLYLRRQRRAERRIWCRDWLLRREDLGAFTTLLTELREEDMKSFLNFLRMSPGIYKSLLQKVTPLIQKENTSCRKAISPGLRLAITLRYLATGKLKQL